MYNWFSKSLAVASLLTLGLAACKKDEVKVTTPLGDAPVLTASSTNVGVLTRANRDNVALTYSWTPYTIGLSDNSAVVSPVVYTLQMAKAGTGFATLQEIVVSSATASSLAIKVGELNTKLLALNLPFGQSARVDVRLKTFVAGNLPVFYSAATTLTATPYDECVAPNTDTWGLVGPAGDGWPRAAATDRPLTWDCNVQAYVLRNTRLNAGDFKFRRNTDWAVNLGALVKPITPGATPIALKPNGEDMTVSTPGVYTVKLVVTSTGGTVIGGTLTVTP